MQQFQKPWSKHDKTFCKETDSHSVHISVMFRSNLTCDIPFKDDPHIVEQKLDATNWCCLRTFEIIIYILPVITMLMGSLGTSQNLHDGVVSDYFTLSENHEVSRRSPCAVADSGF